LMQTLYRLNGLSKSYGRRTALVVADLTLRPGMLYTLTGANGSGKTTLLSILAFLTSPTAGVLYYRGERVRRDNASLLQLRREVTLLHQSPYLFNGSVQANVSFGLRIRGIRGEELRRGVGEALELVGLGGFEHRSTHELSGGEAHRVALARALALRPRVLLLDEPLANVDRTTTELLENVIVSLPAQGTTVVITTHDPELLLRLGGERIHLVAGEPAAQLCPEPATVAGEFAPYRPLTKPAVSFMTL
jgi:tungstate transport system ATP-binding protein